VLLQHLHYFKAVNTESEPVIYHRVAVEFAHNSALWNHGYVAHIVAVWPFLSGLDTFGVHRNPQAK
jgi:hypothetical protein